jgi:hypothetical protein
MIYGGIRTKRCTVAMHYKKFDCDRLVLVLVQHLHIDIICKLMQYGLTPFNKIK